MTTSSTAYRQGGETRTQPTKSRRREVEHFYWVREGEIAAEMGVDVRHLCGTWGEAPTSDDVANPNVVEVVGRLMPLPEPEDCKRCLRVLEAYQRRRWEQAR